MPQQVLRRSFLLSAIASVLLLTVGCPELTRIGQTCQYQNDCPGFSFCNKGGECAALVACQKDGDCDGNAKCLGNACADLECSADKDCPEGMYCDSNRCRLKTSSDQIAVTEPKFDEQPQCKTDSECVNVLGKLDQCMKASCVGGSCEATSQLAGTPCEDGKFCSVGDTCDGKGACQAGQPLDCSAKGDQCKIAICDEAQKACVAAQKPDGTSCNDGMFCTIQDVCNAGTCVGGKPRDCSAAANQCTDGTCDEENDRCGIAKPLDTACSDGNLCTTNACDGKGACLVKSDVPFGSPCGKFAMCDLYGTCTPWSKQDVSASNSRKLRTINDLCTSPDGTSLYVMGTENSGTDFQTKGGWGTYHVIMAKLSDGLLVDKTEVSSFPSANDWPSRDYSAACHDGVAVVTREFVPEIEMIDQGEFDEGGSMQTFKQPSRSVEAYVYHSLLKDWIKSSGLSHALMAWGLFGGLKPDEVMNFNQNELSRVIGLSVKSEANKTTVHLAGSLVFYDTTDDAFYSNGLLSCSQTGTDGPWSCATAPLDLAKEKNYVSTNVNWLGGESLFVTSAQIQKQIFCPFGCEVVPGDNIVIGPPSGLWEFNAMTSTTNGAFSKLGPAGCDGTGTDSNVPCYQTLGAPGLFGESFISGVGFGRLFAHKDKLYLPAGPLAPLPIVKGEPQPTSLLYKGFVLAFNGQWSKLPELPDASIAALFPGGVLPEAVVVFLKLGVGVGDHLLFQGNVFSCTPSADQCATTQRREFVVAYNANAGWNQLVAINPEETCAPTLVPNKTGSIDTLPKKTVKSNTVNVISNELPSVNLRILDNCGASHLGPLNLALHKTAKLQHLYLISNMERLNDFGLMTEPKIYTFGMPNK